MRIISILAFSLISQILFSQDLPNIDIRSVKSDSRLEINLDSDENFDQVVSSLVFTIKWNNLTGNLGNINLSSQYPISKSGEPFVDGIYSYQVFVGFGFSPISNFNSVIGPNNPYQLGYFNIDGDGYEIVNDDITQSINGDYYVSLNGEDRTRNIINDVLLSTTVDDFSVISQSNLLFPNPFNDYFEIRSVDSPNRIQVLDLSGKVIYESTLNSDRKIFDASSLSSGQYLIKIIFTNKFVIVRGSKI
jgi:hypothetical protein